MKKSIIVLGAVGVSVIALAVNTMNLELHGTISTAGNPDITDVTGNSLDISSVYGAAREDISSTVTFKVTGQAGHDALPGHFEYANSVPMTTFRYSALFITAPVTEGSQTGTQVPIDSVFDFTTLGSDTTFTSSAVTYSMTYGVPSSATTTSLGTIAENTYFLNIRVVYN